MASHPDPRLSSLLDSLVQGHFLVMGRVGMDLTPLPLGEPVESAQTMMTSMGGSAANIAAGLTRQGCGAALITCVSADAVGDYCLAQLDQYGIDRTHVRKVSGDPRSSLAVTEARMEGHRTVIYRNNAADFMMSDQDVEAVDYSRFGALITAGTVFAAEPSRSAAFKALELAAAAGVPVIFDIDYRPYSWASPAEAKEVLSRAAAASQMVVGNDEEFDALSGGEGLGAARKSAATLTVYKRGPHGAITFAGGEEITTGIYRVDPLKPVGSGDAFLAGLLAALAQKLPLREALLRGSAAAAMVVTKPGCAPAMPTPQELDSFIAAHPGPS